VVLRSLNTPSVLVELGYLSNAADAAALAGPDHRAALADAIFRAVTAYFGRG
jgi:N-acetylmuramoyl-L-alanine amidase